MMIGIPYQSNLDLASQLKELLNNISDNLIAVASNFTMYGTH